MDDGSLAKVVQYGCTDKTQIQYPKSSTSNSKKYLDVFLI
jgi:hypothetical protein